MESRVQRVEALRQAAAALGTRLEEEAARLGVAAGLTLNPTPGLTGPTMGPESTFISEDLPTTWEHSESPAEVGGTENRATSATAENEYAMDSGVVVQGSAVTAMRANEPLLIAQGPQTPIERPHTTHDAAEQLLPLLEGRVTPQSQHSDSSDNTESTSKWSELSGFFGGPELLSRLSLAISQHSLREEELRARQHSALCRLREEALWEKTQAELAWLEHRRRCLRTGEKGALADITIKQEEVVNRMRKEQAEIRHWQNLYRCGRQQRKLLLQHQREVVEIRRSAAQLMQDLQGQETAPQSKGWAEPRGTQSSPGEGQSQCMDSPEDMPPCFRDPPVTVQQGDKRYHALRPVCGSSPLASHRPHCPRKGPEYQEQDVSETRGSDLCLGCGWTCLTVQRGQASVSLSQSVPKTPWDPVRDRAEESQPGRWRSDLLLEHKGVSQDSQSVGQERNRPTAQPAATADMEARVEHSVQRVSGKKTPEASRQHAEGTFFSKTDASLRRLLSSEDVWTWGRRRATPAVMAPVEQDEVDRSEYPSSSSGYPQKGQPQPERVYTLRGGAGVRKMRI
ncbi:hypothetical protein AAFF_G00010110 [Aldrovandia affinis]|uniref:Uncharacterized protein n=1 Tax=Aldrovandia affinis TaxID=143900 RepID=A0AAD7S708_9TELE|nr:hypothetical protein AAFF_G00010110 [Aldrovandia affinis]